MCVNEAVALVQGTHSNSNTDGWPDRWTEISALRHNNLKTLLVANLPFAIVRPRSVDFPRGVVTCRK